MSLSHRSYVVAIDHADENALWVTEVWGSSEAHAARLDLANVQAALAKAKPIIAGSGSKPNRWPDFGLMSNCSS